MEREYNVPHKNGGRRIGPYNVVRVGMTKNNQMIITFPRKIAVRRGITKGSLLKFVIRPSGEITLEYKNETDSCYRCRD